MNVGAVDRIIRVVAGLGLLSLLFMLEGNARLLSLIGIVPLATALVGYCPLYDMLGLRTCSVKHAPHG